MWGRRVTPSFADLDGDGDLDAVVGTFDGTLHYFQNTGTAIAAAFTEQTGAANPFNGLDVGGWARPNFADLDGDGDLDAVVGEGFGTLHYFENTGSAIAAVFTARTGAANPFNGVDLGSFSNPSFADLDGDGDLDAIVGEATGILHYLKNTGAGFTCQRNGAERRRHPLRRRARPDRNQRRRRHLQLRHAHHQRPRQRGDLRGAGRHPGHYGTFAITSAGAWTYAASSAHNEFAAGTTHTDTFAVASSDGTPTSVTINIAGSNDTPAANAQSLGTDKDTAIAVTLSGSDADGDSLVFAVLSAPSSGSGANRTYTPDAGYLGWIPSATWPTTARWTARRRASA